MDAALLTKPEVEPISTCSSFSGKDTSSQSTAGAATSDSRAEKKDAGNRKRRNLDLGEIEAARQRRHEEKMAMQSKYLDLFEKLIEKL